VAAPSIASVTDYAWRERQQLADLLSEVGPDAPTLCAGWTTRDLAAHLVVRERRPDAALGAVVPALRGRTEQLRRATAARPYGEVVDEVRRPPWWSPLSSPVTRGVLNRLEFFIHHEDVRRGRPGAAPRALEPEQELVLWRQVRFTAKLGLRRLDVPVLVRAPGFGELRIGTEQPRATLTGTPGELALFVSGRQGAARVDVEAAAELADRLRTARLGL
jgi:uncharacterized protein (TIGR03085 family)